MKEHYPKYDEWNAPTVKMPTGEHYNTTGEFNKWAAEIKRRTGSFDWKNVTEADMRRLSEQMFDAGKVPKEVREAYWREFDEMLKRLKEGTAR